MKRVTFSMAVMFLACGLALAQEAKPTRFEIYGGTGLPSVLSGPDLEGNSNIVLRFGFMPTENFMLTLTYDHWDGNIASDDVLNSYFAEVYRDTVNSATDFNDALLTDSTMELDQLEVSLVKAIPLGENKKWELFIGVGLGMQNATADVSWTGATKRLPDGSEVPADPELPDEALQDDGVVFFAVRGGASWLPLPWLALQTDLRLLPVNETFEESLNTLEVNFGVAFRFGKF